MLTFIVATLWSAKHKDLLPSAVGAAVVVIVYALGFVSGGHLNPAVTFSFLLSRKIPVCKGMCYLILQCVAGLLAGLFFELVFLKPAPGVMPVAPFSFTQAAWFELVFTCMLCFVVLNVAGSTRNNPDQDKNQFFPLAYGFAVTAAGYAGAHISGAAVNPAIAIGLDLTDGHLRWGLPYALMEILGGMLAAVLFVACRSEDYQAQPLVRNELASYSPPLGARMLSEFVGTFWLCLTFGLSVILLSTAAAWSVGAALLSMVYALGNVSGGHFNPAVTAAVCMSGRDKCSRGDVLCYWMAQLFGGVMAGSLMRYMHNEGPTRTRQFDLVGLSSGYYWGTIATMEIFFTFLLAYTVLAVATCSESSITATRPRQNFYFAVAIGFAMCVGVIAAGPISGGYLNPAAALAFATESAPYFVPTASVEGWPDWTRPLLQFISLLCQYVGFLGHWLLYFFFELTGAALATVVFRLTHPTEYQKQPSIISYVQSPVSGGQYS